MFCFNTSIPHSVRMYLICSPASVQSPKTCYPEFVMTAAHVYELIKHILRARNPGMHSNNAYTYNAYTVFQKHRVWIQSTSVHYFYTPTEYPWSTSLAYKHGLSGFATRRLAATKWKYKLVACVQLAVEWLLLHTLQCISAEYSPAYTGEPFPTKPHAICTILNYSTAYSRTGWQHPP